MTTPASTPAVVPDPRVSLAIERTLLAWLRTGIALMGFGFVIARFGLFLRELAERDAPAPAHPGGVSAVTGIALVLAGIGVNLWAGIRHSRMLREVSRGEPAILGLRGPAAIAIASCVGGALLVLILLGVFGR